MEFIKRMKKREFIEMSLKALAGIILAFVAVILMEGMIYSITLNAYKTKGKISSTNSDNTIVYCMKDGVKDNEDQYFLLFYTEYKDENNNTVSYWSADSRRMTDDVIKSDYVDKNYEVVWHAPNAFDFTISPIHFVVISIFVVGVSAYFVYRFIRLGLSYKEVEETYKKTGTIEITNK